MLEAIREGLAAVFNVEAAVTVGLTAAITWGVNGFLSRIFGKKSEELEQSKTKDQPIVINVILPSQQNTPALMT